MIFVGCTGGSGGASAGSVSGPGGVSAGGAASQDASSGCKGAGAASEGASSGGSSGSGSGSGGCSSSSGPGCGSVSGGTSSASTSSSGGCAGAKNSSSGRALWAFWAACSAWAACAPLTAGPAASTSAKAKLTNRFQTECFISAAFLSGRVAFAWFVYAVCPAYALMVPERVCSIWSESVLGA